jgi:GT2 family glycosyltransferase
MRGVTLPTRPERRQKVDDLVRDSHSSGECCSNMTLLVCSAAVIRRECLDRIGGFDPEIRLMEDADYHVRAIRTFGVRFLDRTSIHYRIGTPSLML